MNDAALAPRRQLDPVELAAWPQRVVAELSAAFGQFDGAVLADLARSVLAARRVVCAGQGRSGLIAGALAIRLGHLGVQAHVAGEATAPAVGAGDLLFAFSRSGSTTITAHQLHRAQRAGARTALVTARADAELAERADLVVALPVLEPPSRQHAGSLFEQATLILADSLTAGLQQALQPTDADLAARHDNLQ